ncbi:YciI family protein [Chryseobacterium sp. Ch-15]|uniref:YciI family protein n=2 Tax=Chryseobacterium muglaense TaxID=2893752 RepID=A0A9Q3UTH5_9FLAO|nr:YciI family protein [Chryseobacterium muglaense]MCC9034834.1 YciI family protein [Chryseobacterium muglaense]MCM2553099.1 YciI family protein [Chryseobacterium muglaense]
MMKNLFLLSGIAFTLISCSIQKKAQNGTPGKDGASSNSKLSFNQKLADSLGADKYGMKAYTIVMLTTGSAEIDDKEKKAALMKGHMENIGKLAKEGKIIVAGPFLEKNKENYRGMFIFNTKSKEEAESWVKTDPAVAAGIFSYEIFPWYGSAALPLYLKHHDKISKENP